MGSYRVAYSHAFDDNLYALCRSGVGTHYVNVFSTGGRTAVCPWNTRGHVYWEGGAYTPRWSTIRGPVSSMYTCYYFGTYNVKITQVKIYPPERRFTGGWAWITAVMAQTVCAQMIDGWYDSVPWN